MDSDSEESGFGEVTERELPENETDEAGEQIETESEEGQDDGSEQTDNQESEDANEDSGAEDDSQESKQETTEKGTKLDPNPKSAVHQQLANERRIRGQMERVLADPTLIAKFVKEQYGIEVPVPGAQAPQEQAQATTTKKWTAKDFENIEDVADKFNQLQETFTQTMSEKDRKIEDLQKQVTGVLDNSRLSQMADTAASDVASLRALPELNPKSPDFIEGLEGQISDLYHRLDFDETTGTYRGQFSIKELGNQLINTARAARKAGIQRGQTIVKDKTGGRVRTSPNAGKVVDTSEMSPGASIASGIAKMFK